VCYETKAARGQNFSSRRLVYLIFSIPASFARIAGSFVVIKKQIRGGLWFCVTVAESTPPEHCDLFFAHDVRQM
jgi:hypothetical protein